MVRWTTTMGLLAGDSTAASAVFTDNLNGWWEEINSSKVWQKNIFSVLSGCYSVVSFTALVQLIRIQSRVPEYGWTTQKTFHFMNFIVNGLRAVLFAFYDHVFLLRPRYHDYMLNINVAVILLLIHLNMPRNYTGKYPSVCLYTALEMALLDFPGLLFFTTYTLLVLFWAEIYHQAKNLPLGKLRPAYLIINVAVYLIQLLVWVCSWIGSSSVFIEISELFFAVFSFLAALGFVVYGGRLFFLLRRFPIQSRGRQKKMIEVGSVTSICCICFVIRSGVVAYSAFNKGADLDVLDHPILNFTYYMLVEVIPSSLVLFILRKLPPRRSSEQYHPIS